MIPDEILTPIGHTLKTHGINGEINAVTDAEIDIDSLSCIIMKIDGINVPFFVESWRSRGSEAVLIKFDNISNETEAETYCGKELMALTSELPQSDGHYDEDGFYASDLIGWQISDNGSTVGTVDDFDDSTENLLLSVTTPQGKRILVPFADELIIDIFPEDHKIDMNLPDGLNEL